MAVQRGNDQEFPHSKGIDTPDMSSQQFEVVLFAAFGYMAGSMLLDMHPS